MCNILENACRCIRWSRRVATTRLESIENADFERAIASTGYGRFNHLLILISIPCTLACINSTTSASFILPSAQCDLDLQLVDKGGLNAIVFAGMVSSAILWGYVSDILGRKKLLAYGYLLNGVCEMIGAFSQKLWFLMIFKFLSGFAINGPYAIILTYFTEFLGMNHRARMILNIGMLLSLGNTVLALLAMVFLTRYINITIIPDVVTLHSWQIYLLVCSTASFISGLLIMLFPESPKFLMAQGRNVEAMAALQTVFNINTGRPKNDYPVKSLKNEMGHLPSTADSSNLEDSSANITTNLKQNSFKALTSSISQLGPLFHKPLLGVCLLMFTIEFFLLFGLNTFRLWMPQIFAGYYTAEEMNNTSTVPLCVVVENYINKGDRHTSPAYKYDMGGKCISTYSTQTFVKSVIVCTVSVFMYLIADGLVKLVGNRVILFSGLFISATACIGMYLAKNSITTLILSSTFVSVASVASFALIGITVNTVPTSLRTMIVSVTMMFGRCGAIIGNYLFPVLISLGCLPPFLTIGLVLIAAGCLSFALKDTNKIPLK